MPKFSSPMFANIWSPVASCSLSNATTSLVFQKWKLWCWTTTWLSRFQRTRSMILALWLTFSSRKTSSEVFQLIFSTMHRFSNVSEPQTTASKSWKVIFSEQTKRWKFARWITTSSSQSALISDHTKTWKNSTFSTTLASTQASTIGANKIRSPVFRWKLKKIASEFLHDKLFNYSSAVFIQTKVIKIRWSWNKFLKVVKNCCYVT